MPSRAYLSPAEIETLSTDIEREFREAVAGGAPLIIVKAPPGSGKTHLLLRGVARAREADLRIAIGAQTNSQADDICRRLGREYGDIPVVRFAAQGSAPLDLGASVRWVTDKNHLAPGPCVVVATIAKWSLTNLVDHYDILLVDEAWQMSWSDFMLCSQVAPRFALIGDPGQIPPVVPIAVNRWETSPRAPHQPAPELILADSELTAVSLELPACRRLPHDSVDLVRPFYDFEFASLAQPGERSILARRRSGEVQVADRALALLRDGSIAAVTLPTPSDGPPLELDRDVVAATVQIALRALERGVEVMDGSDGKKRKLRPEDIGLVATHRVVNMAMYQALPTEMRGRVRVDTPERWQGLECKLMIMVHPLSGVLAPSAFDLETGRLCVMTSRHRAGLIVVARDHIRQSLETHIPSAAQAVGRPDVTGRGHEANLRFWETIEDHDRVVQAT